MCEEPLFEKLTSALVYFVSARAFAGETIQVPHMHIVIDIEAVITKDSFLSTKKPGEESRLQNRWSSILEPFEPSPAQAVAIPLHAHYQKRARMSSISSIE
jgi:hypothetical protein